MKKKLTAAEQRLLKSYHEKAGWQSKGTRARQAYTKLAQRQRKEQRINIRLSAETLKKLRHDAMVEGLAYQTFIASVLHRYASGRLHDEQHIRQALKLVQ